MRNVITSMRLISSVNWAEFFETVSPVDAVLRKGSDFAAMDFATRDLYRRAIEEIARGSGRDESDVASRALAEARQAAQQPVKSLTTARESDPGYYLIGADASRWRTRSRQPRELERAHLPPAIPPRRRGVCGHDRRGHHRRARRVRCLRSLASARI